MKYPARSPAATRFAKIAWLLGTGLGVVLFAYAARLPSLAGDLNDTYWHAHYQPYFWRSFTDGESMALGMGLQALVVGAGYGILTQALPRTAPLYRQLRWVLRFGLLLSCLSWSLWLLGLLLF